MSQINSVPDIQDELCCPSCGSTNFKKAGLINGKQRYRCKRCNKQFINQPKLLRAKDVLPKGITAQEMRSYDVWDLRILGKKANTRGGYTLNFSTINIQWLKVAIKEWMWKIASVEEAGTLLNKLTRLKKFSEYLDSAYPYLKSQHLDREVILGYLNYISYLDGAGQCLSALKVFLVDCQRLGYADIPSGQLVWNEDYPKRTETLPRDIPDYVLKQLDDNIHHLAEPIVRLVQILRETGVRISEVCELKFSCIRQDGEGDWWLTVHRCKMKKESLLIITRDLASKILEQQKYIRKNLDSDFPYLFCNTEGAGWFSSYGYKNQAHKRREINHFLCVANKIPQNVVRGYIRQLAEEHNITEISGDRFEIWKCHSFRHTHLTELARKGTGITHIMQRAGHKSPAMSMQYIHLTNEDQKIKMKEVWDNTHFNLEGEIVASPNPELDVAELQWIKKGMNVQTSDNGYCTLLATQNCPYQTSPCKECGSWITTLEFLDAHKKELEETEKIIENARQKEWQRQVEKNVPRAERLKKIINGMEKHKTMKGLGHNDWEKEGDNGSK